MTDVCDDLQPQHERVLQLVRLRNEAVASFKDYSEHLEKLLQVWEVQIEQPNTVELIISVNKLEKVLAYLKMLQDRTQSLFGMQVLIDFLREQQKKIEVDTDGE